MNFIYLSLFILILNHCVDCSLRVLSVFIFYCISTYAVNKNDTHIFILPNHDSSSMNDSKHDIGGQQNKQTKKEKTNYIFT